MNTQLKTRALALAHHDEVTEEGGQMQCTYLKRSEAVGQGRAGQGLDERYPWIRISALCLWSATSPKTHVTADL